MYGCYKFFDISEDSLLKCSVTVNRVIGFLWSFESWRVISNEIINIWSDTPFLALFPIWVTNFNTPPPPNYWHFVEMSTTPFVNGERGCTHYVYISLWYNFRVFQFHASLFDLILSSFFNKISIVSKIDEQI